MHVSIGFLLFIGVVGVLVSSADDAGNLEDRKMTSSLTGIGGVSMNELPKRVFFNLFTRATWNNSEKLYVGDTASVRNSHFKAWKPTKIVIHGWQSSSKNQIGTSIRDAFLQNSDCNVILIEWSSIAKYEYVWASNQVTKVARFVGNMIDFLCSQGMDPSKTTVVGHSLGAHIAGLSSYNARNKVNYVVALDPAGPNFHGVGLDSRVSKGDAAYVQVIHTSNHLGMEDQIGDVDFYPNGGSSQVGCGADMGDSCSHPRSYEYFAESINSGGFLARKCNNYNDFKSGKCNSNPVARMGGATPNFNVKGRYYLSTNSKSPFAMN